VLVTCALRVRILHKGGSSYDVKRGTPRDASTAGEDGECECDANESSARARGPGPGLQQEHQRRRPW
jgi:hypothetical protein